jgi:hypothetical protein
LNPGYTKGITSEMSLILPGEHKDYLAEFCYLSMSMSDSGGLISPKPAVVEAGLLGSESDLLYNAVMTTRSFPSGVT